MLDDENFFMIKCEFHLNPNFFLDSTNLLYHCKTNVFRGVYWYASVYKILVSVKAQAGV